MSNNSKSQAIMGACIMFLICLGGLFITGLGQQSTREHNAVNKYGTKIIVGTSDYGRKTKVTVIDDCEYIQYQESIVHKGNCKNPECPERK